MLSDVKQWLEHEVAEGCLDYMPAKVFRNGACYSILGEVMSAPALIVLIPDDMYPMPGVQSQIDECYMQKGQKELGFTPHWWNACNQFKGLWRMLYDDDDKPAGFRAVWFYGRPNNRYLPEGENLVAMASGRAVISALDMWSMNYQTMCQDYQKYHGAFPVIALSPSNGE